VIDVVLVDISSNNLAARVNGRRRGSLILAGTRARNVEWSDGAVYLPHEAVSGGVGIDLDAGANSRRIDIRGFRSLKRESASPGNSETGDRAGRGPHEPVIDADGVEV